MLKFSNKRGISKMKMIKIDDYKHNKIPTYMKV